MVWTAVSPSEHVRHRTSWSLSTLLSAPSHHQANRVWLLRVQRAATVAGRRGLTLPTSCRTLAPPFFSPLDIFFSSFLNHPLPSDPNPRPSNTEPQTYPLIPALLGVLLVSIITHCSCSFLDIHTDKAPLIAPSYLTLTVKGWRAPCAKASVVQCNSIGSAIQLHCVRRAHLWH